MRVQNSTKDEKGHVIKELIKNFLTFIKTYFHKISRMDCVDLTKKQKAIFKTLTVSKIVHLSLVINVPTKIINKRNKIQKEFIWNGNNLKIKYTSLCKNMKMVV